jgi:hypothetical protein
MWEWPDWVERAFSLGLRGATESWLGRYSYDNIRMFSKEYLFGFIQILSVLVAW